MEVELGAGENEYDCVYAAGAGTGAGVTASPALGGGATGIAGPVFVGCSGLETGCGAGGVRVIEVADSGNEVVDGFGFGFGVGVGAACCAAGGLGWVLVAGCSVVLDGSDDSIAVAVEASGFSPSSVGLAFALTGAVV